MQRWKLHLRIALRVVMLVGSRPTRLVLGFMIATAVLSMWVSNTATAVMMLPIGVSVLREKKAVRRLVPEWVRAVEVLVISVNPIDEEVATGEGHVFHHSCDRRRLSQRG